MMEKKVFVGPGRDSHGATTLRTVGEGLYGSQWQSELARRLTGLHPKEKRVTQQMVARWAAGERSIPQWVWAAALDVIDDKTIWLAMQKDALRVLAGDVA